ncbi:hypothetical protein O4H49_02965 [Kiloniella laminariae]|uniref:Uncharacterized protein n=1 Tax=Kiloniella laminariae TaxID=454162 RepID=A0ABT4LF52_9PROT|nr:hypothetical protein [Kiloniella laminariae]MCZ4279724.1 hypothetical protein [Kiloniella laminariae]
MPEIYLNQETTINHPDIVEFLRLCDQVRGQGYMTIPLIQNRPFLSYWPTLILNRWDAEKQDFFYSYWGSGLAAVYGMDLSWKYIKRGEFPQTENIFWQAHHDVMTQLKPVYLATSIHWLNKDFQQLNAVILPLERNGTVSETLAYVSFDQKGS